MASTVFFATYHIKITNRTLSEQILSQFNGSTDLFDVLTNFFNDLFINQRNEKNDEENNTTIHFTLKDRPIVDKKSRVIYGFIDSGLSGDSSTIKDIKSNEQVFEVDPDNHGAFKELFFYCKIPANRKRGFLILQKKASHGVKGATEKMIKKWLREEGYNDSYFWLNSVVNGAVFNMMLEKGNLKKVELIYNWAPETMEDLLTKRDGGVQTTKGKLKTVVTSNTSLGQSWKDIARNAIGGVGKRTVIEASYGVPEYDEMQFTLDFKGKTKTFYARSKNRTLPDIDVTEDIVFQNRKPILSTLVSKSEEVIRDVFNYTEDV